MHFARKALAGAARHKTETMKQGLATDMSRKPLSCDIEG